MKTVNCNKKAKTRKLSELSKTEQNRLAKLNAMLDELRRGENVQNRRLATWLTEEEYVRPDKRCTMCNHGLRKGHQCKAEKVDSCKTRVLL